jgi:hypothetical protein
MESPKVINKVLLSSVAFGVSFGIGMLVSKADIKKALTTGAIAIPASLAGALVSERKKADGENLVEDSLPTGVQELKIQEDGLHQSIAEATMRMQEVEAGINSLQTEHTQLLENISDLNSQKQQLESQKEAIETSIAVQQTELEQISDRFIQAHQQQEELDAYLTKLESRKQELETENQNLQAQIQELEQQHAQLAQAIAPLEEEPAESEAFEDRSGEELISFASEESLEDLKDTDESSATSWNELTVTEAESDNSVGEVEGVCLEELGNLSEEAVSVAVELTDEESIPVETPMDEMEEIAAEQEISVEQLDSIEQEQIDSLTELKLTDEDSQQLDNLFAENPVADDDYALEESAQAEFSTEDFVASEQLMEEIAAEQEISVEQLDSIEQEQIDSLTELELTDEDSQQLDNLFAENPIVDDDYALEESAQAESATEDFVASEQLIDYMEGIGFETTEQSSWAELDNFEEENATIVFTPSESMAEDSEELDNLFDSTTTFDSESLENLMDETAELGILDIVGELAQPESVESKIEKSVTLEGLMSQEPQEAQTELTKELDEHFFNSITEGTEEESTDTEQKSERLDYLINSSYTSESSELETPHGESEFLENLIDNTEENFLENFESVEKLPETEINENSTIDHFLNESLDLEDSFERWEGTSEEFDRLDDLATSISMSESSIQEELEIVDEKICELDTISEASLEEFKDLLESMDEENTSISFSDDVDDIETTKIQNLWD